MYTVNLHPTGPTRPRTVEVATGPVHPSYSQVPQVTPTPSRPLLASVPPAQMTAPQFPTAFPQYSSPSSFNLSPPDKSPISPPGTVTTPLNPLQPVIVCIASYSGLVPRLFLVEERAWKHWGVGAVYFRYVMVHVIYSNHALFLKIIM